MLQRAKLTVSAEVAFSEPSLLSMPTARPHLASTAPVTLVLRVTQTDKLVGNLLTSAVAILSHKFVLEETCSTVLAMTTGMG